MLSRTWAALKLLSSAWISWSNGPKLVVTQRQGLTTQSSVLRPLLPYFVRFYFGICLKPTRSYMPIKNKLGYKSVHVWIWQLCEYTDKNPSGIKTLPVLKRFLYLEPKPISMFGFSFRRKHLLARWRQRLSAERPGLKRKCSQHFHS